MLLPVKWIIQYLKDNNVDYVVHYNKTKKRIIDRFMHILVGDFNENNNNFRKPQSKGKHS